MGQFSSMEAYKWWNIIAEEMSAMAFSVKTEKYNLHNLNEMCNFLLTFIVYPQAQHQLSAYFHI